MRLPNRKYPNARQPNSPDPLMTLDKYQGLKTKLDKLINEDRPQAAQEVAELAGDGDFSENAGYQAAKQILRSINNNITRLENILKKAQIIKKNTSGLVQIGSLVTVEVNGRSKQLRILGSSQTDPSQNIISYSSPVGAALLNKKINDQVNVNLNDKIISYKITAID